MAESWYGLSTDELIGELDTSPQGLSDDVATARLEQYGANEIEFKKTPAWVRFLLQRGANPNIRNNNGITPLQLATRLGFVEGAEELLKKGAMVNVADSQGETPLMQVCVDSQAVAEIVANWTGIPVGRMVTNEINSILGLKDAMQKRVVGQDHALDAIAQKIPALKSVLGD